MQKDGTFIYICGLFISLGLNKLDDINSLTNNKKSLSQRLHKNLYI